MPPPANLDVKPAELSPTPQPTDAPNIQPKPSDISPSVLQVNALTNTVAKPARMMTVAQFVNVSANTVAEVNPAEVMPTPQPVETPANSQLEVKPAETAPVTQPVTPPANAQPEVKPADTAPAPQPVTPPANAQPEVKPADTVPTPQPVTTPTTAQPEVKPTETAPTPQPVETPANAQPEVKPAETAPASQPVTPPANVQPEVKPADTTPTPQPVETPATVQKQEVAPVKNESVETMLMNLNTLKQEQSALVDRFQLVVDQLAEKGGNVESYNKYIAAISGLNINVSDSQALRIAVINWITSKDGGLLWIINAVIFTSCVGIAWFVAHWLTRLITPYLSAISSLSGLMRAFLIKIIYRGILVMGVLVGLTALGVSLAPLLALLGGVSFILAFALQGNLNNFASGLMILFYKPFDVGDEIKLTSGDATLWGKVDSITLANTKLNGFSQELITIPNAFVWENVITNLTHEKRRQINIPIHIGHHEDLSKLKPLLIEAISSHSKILKTPAPSVLVWKVESDYVEVVVKGWTEAEDFWGIYEEVLCLIQPKLQNQAIDFSSPSLLEKN